MDIVEWYPEYHSAKACWHRGHREDGSPIEDDYPACGILQDFYPQCYAIEFNSELIPADQPNAEAGDWWAGSRVILKNNETHPLDYWTPRGRIYTQLPKAKHDEDREKEFEGLWVMEISDDSQSWDCRDFWESQEFKPGEQI